MTRTNTWMLMSALVIGSVALTGCDTASRTAEAGAREKIAAGEVALIAQAPDGTRLWGITPPGEYRRVYFAASGTSTSHTRSCGKNCTRRVIDEVSTRPPLAE